MDCVWSIYNTNGKSLRVSFVDVDIEEDPYCTYDYVEVIEVNATGTIERLYYLHYTYSSQLYIMHNIGRKSCVRIVLTYSLYKMVANSQFNSTVIAQKMAKDLLREQRKA